MPVPAVPLPPSSSSSTVPTAQEIVDAIDLHFMNQLDNGGVLDYSIGGTRITRYSLAELTKLREVYVRLASVANGVAKVTYAKMKRIGS